MNSRLVFLLFAAWRLMIVESLSLDLCPSPPPFTTPEINFVLGSGDVCASSDKDFEIVGSAVQLYTFVGGFFPRTAGEMACVVSPNKLLVYSNSPNPSAGRADLSVTTTNGMTYNFSLFYTSGAVLPISSPTLTFSEGDEVTMTWLHFFNRPNLTLYHYTPDGRIRTFPISTMFGDVAGASGEYLNDLQPACATNQMQVATRSIIIKNLTAALGGSYALVYSNETAENALANITVAVLPAPTPPASPVIISTPTTTSDTPSSTGSNMVASTSNSPTLSTAAPVNIAVISAVVLFVVIAIAVFLGVVIIAASIVYRKKQRSGTVDLTKLPNGGGRSPQINRQTSNRRHSDGSTSSQTNLVRSGSGSTSGSFSTPGTPAQPEYTGVYATREYTDIKKKMLDKYGDMVHDIKSKDDMITALLHPHCKEIFAFAGSNGNTDWNDIFREVESRGFCPNPESPKITRVIFTDSDPTDGQYVETGRVRFIQFEGSHDEPDILAKLMMISDRPVLKKEMTQRSSQGTLTTQDSRYSKNETDHPSPIIEAEEHTFHTGPPSDHSDSPAVTHVKSELLLSGSPTSTPSPVRQDRHPTAAKSMQHTTAKPMQVEQLELQGSLQSTSEPMITSSTDRIVHLLEKQYQLQRQGLTIWNSINQNTQKSAEKQAEQVEILTDIHVAVPAPVPVQDPAPVRDPAPVQDHAPHSPVLP